MIVWLHDALMQGSACSASIRTYSTNVVVDNGNDMMSTLQLSSYTPLRQEFN